MSYSQFVCLSGLPRSGSTLLSAILSQNPLIHAEGNSAVCQIMWDLQQSCVTTAKEQLGANNRIHTIHDLISSVPHIYYKHNHLEEKIVVDKCRSWTIPDNVEMLKKYIDNNIKVIILERPILEIVSSFSKLYNDNNIAEPTIQQRLTQMIEPNSEPIMRSLGGIIWTKQNNQHNNFLFISYDELISKTQETVEKIYTFCNWEPFTHNFQNIIPKYKENDAIYKLNGQHDIRNQIVKRKYEVVIADEIIQKCTTIDTIVSKLKTNSQIVK